LLRRLGIRWHLLFGFASVRVVGMSRDAVGVRSVLHSYAEPTHFLKPIIYLIHQLFCLFVPVWRLFHSRLALDATFNIRPRTWSIASRLRQSLGPSGQSGYSSSAWRGLSGSVNPRPWGIIVASHRGWTISGLIAAQDRLLCDRIRSRSIPFLNFKLPT
jgi:hypothetical protein